MGTSITFTPQYPDTIMLLKALNDLLEYRYADMEAEEYTSITRDTPWLIEAVLEAILDLGVDTWPKEWGENFNPSVKAAIDVYKKMQDEAAKTTFGDHIPVPVYKWSRNNGHKPEQPGK